MIPLESLPDAVVTVDRHGTIVRANRRAEELFEYERGALIGQPLELLIPTRLREGHRSHRDSYLRAPTTRPMGRGMLTALRRSGREVPVEIMLSPDAEGGVVAVVRDVSRRRDLEHFRDEYIGYISHDLKNPLSVISLQARLLSQQLAGRQLHDELRAVEVIAQSAAFIDRLVRELLEMSYLESEHVQIHAEPTELTPFLKAVLERTVSTSDRPRITLEVEALVAAAVEPTRLERVVVNFVQNALKYSPPGSPIVVRLAASQGMAVVSVIDRGPGLSAEEADYVFDKYRRAPTERKAEGLGLGLYICRKIVEAHGGHVRVNSAPGHGATFSFTVPLVRIEEKLPFAIRLETTDGEDPGARLRGVHVLLVDDEVNAVGALVALLGDEGLVVSGATSGAEALILAEQRCPDVVVLDVEMPDMSGLVLLDHLRLRYPDLPAVIMSGYLAHHAGIAESRAATGAAYIGKPVNPDEVIRTIGRLLPTRGAPAGRV